MNDTVEAPNQRVARSTKRSASMPDLRLHEAAWGRSPGRTTKRKRLDTDFDIVIDTHNQVDRFKRQNSDDGYDSIDLTPSHHIPGVLGLAATKSAPPTSKGEHQPSQLPAPLLRVESSQTITPRQFWPHRSPTSQGEPESSKRSISAAEPQSSPQSTSPPEPKASQQSTLTTHPQSSNLANSPSTRPYSLSQREAPSADNQLDKRNHESKPIQKWDPKEWDEDEFDSDDENMSLAVTMKLANELSLLKSFLEIYRKFNIHLGGEYNSLYAQPSPDVLHPSLTQNESTLDIVSGPRHKGFLSLISSTVASLESHTAHLRTLRDEKQRGNPTPSNMEVTAEMISRKFESRRVYLWDIMEEKVDMTNDVERVMWVKKKKAVLGDVMGGTVGYLEGLGEEEGWKGREVREMGERWEKRWKAYGAMDRKGLKQAGWILDV